MTRTSSPNEQGVGASLRDRATRPADQAPTGLGDTASVTSAKIPVERCAPEGMIWRCAACGKEAEDLYGMIGSRSRGWDESCMLNAVPVLKGARL